jgi:hypothetical protein
MEVLAVSERPVIMFINSGDATYLAMVERRGSAYFGSNTKGNAMSRSSLNGTFLHGFARALLILSLLCPLSYAAGDEPVEKLEANYRLPGVGFIRYSWEEIDGTPEVVKIFYSGSPEWIAEQEHPRTHWHEFSHLKTVKFHIADLSRDLMAYVATLDSVTEVIISESRFTDKDTLSPLKEMSWLEHFWIFHSEHDGLGDEVFEFLDGTPNLRSLEIWSYFPLVTDETLLRVSGLERLQVLDILECYEFSDEAVSQIGRLKNLESLRVEFTQSNVVALLKGLQGHEHLSQLRLDLSYCGDERRLDDADIAMIAGITSLESLTLVDADAGSLAPLGDLRNLTRLRLLMVTLQDDTGNFEWLANLPRLESLSLSVVGEHGDTDNFEWLAYLPKLEFLSLSFADEDTFSLSLRPLRGHERLQVLRVPNVVLDEEDIGVLESMPALRVLQVGNRRNSRWHRAAEQRLPDLEIRTSN